MEKPFRIEILAVGSELLTPFFTDTNSLYLTEKLNDLGLDVSFKTIAGDDWDLLATAAADGLNRTDLLITMGGLGPTRDDFTREVFASVLGIKLEFNQDLYQTMEKRFQVRGMEMPHVNKKQAYVFKGADILPNPNGTACGQWLDTGAHKIALLPGPPHEIKPMFDNFVLPRLAAYRTISASRLVLKITGMTESHIETLIEDLYPKDESVRLTILAKPGQIEIHLTGKSKDALKAEEKTRKLAGLISRRLGENVFSTAGESLEEVVGTLLRARKETLAAAESCTGGLLSHRLTNIPGSSDYFLMGAVTYSNSAKIALLDIPAQLIERHGAVSLPVASAMAEGIRKTAGADYGLGITGIAGPGGGTTAKPVGLVCIALAMSLGTEAESRIFLGPREKIKFQASQKALDMLRRRIQTSIPKDSKDTS
ncbi:MAG: competence/damage-inducible protein A [Acidobacteria bacterium]|nr:competence/damage-inducible protein A [Acidobacteriota bacterium]